jgi:hypothetical protein
MNFWNRKKQPATVSDIKPALDADEKRLLKEMIDMGENVISDMKRKDQIIYNQSTILLVFIFLIFVGGWALFKFRYIRIAI